MTVMAERTSHMAVEDFEQIASASPETVTLEFIGTDAHAPTAASFRPTPSSTTVNGPTPTPSS